MSELTVIKQDLSLSQIGSVFAKSGYFSDAKGEAQAIVKIMAGDELGIGPVASMKGIHIIKGQVSFAANTLAAMIKRSGKYNYQVIREDDEACELQFYENGQKAGPPVSFTAAQAKAAGTQNMNKWPAAMLFARCISKGFRSRCPDLALGPVYVPEELGAAVDEEGQPLESPVAASKPTKPPQAPEPQPAPVSHTDDATAPQEVEEAEVRPAARKPCPWEVQYLNYMGTKKQELIDLLGEEQGLKHYRDVCRDNTGEEKSNAVLSQKHYLALKEDARQGLLKEIMLDMKGTLETAVEKKQLDPDFSTEVPQAEAAAAEGEPQAIGTILNGQGTVVAGPTEASQDLFGP